MAFALRQHYRFPVFSPLKYESESRHAYGTVLNVSSVGWRVSGTLPLEPGDVCALRVKLPTRKYVSVAAGKVRWVQGQECGIETLAMNAVSQDTLNDYIQERIKAL